MLDMPDGPPVQLLDVEALPDDRAPPGDYLVLKVAGHSRGVAVDVVQAAGKEEAERAAAVRGDAVLAAIAGAVDIAAAGDHVQAAACMAEEACLHGRPDTAEYQSDMLRQARAELRVARECLAAAGRHMSFVADGDPPAGHRGRRRRAGRRHG